MDVVTDRQQVGSRDDTAREEISALALEESRLAMMRRVKRMTVEERIELFEQLSRDAAWVKGAKRVR